MKKFIMLPLFVIVALLCSCEKDPDTDKLDNDYLVLTNYDSNTDFGKINSFYVIDSILIIDNQTDKPKYWKNENSQKIVNAYNDNFISCGYTQAASGEEADVVFQLSYINTTYYFNNSIGPWWNSYPGYWNWGGWGWYYPFNFYYAYSTGSIIGELVNTKAPYGSDKLTIVWNAYICGLLNGNNLSYSRTMAAINQAFEQSSYLKK